jgi:signal transduction histidine kinase
VSDRSTKNEKARMVESSSSLGMLNASYAATERLSSSMKKPEIESNPPDRRISEKVFERRKRFGCFTDSDAKLLGELKEVFERHSPQVVERFYDHLQDFRDLRSLLAEESVVERLKGFQREYLMSLVSGEYGSAYATERLRIGSVHERVGLDPEWYLGTYGLYLDLLMPLIQERFADDTTRAMQAGTALSKLMILDMQIVLDAYYGKQRRKAVEHTEQLAAVGELAASIAHEVRNPLAGMKGALEVLRKELSVKPSNLEIVDELLAQIVRLEQLVRDLLTFARPRELSLEEFDLHDLLDRLLRLYKDEADGHAVTIERIYGPATGRLTADPRQMEQVFLNLIYNALQAMEGGGTLTVSTRAEKGRIVITLRDTGKGIPEADMPKILQPFFTTRHRGSGLGLPIVKKISEAHGGVIDIESEVGRGTTVTVSIPDGRGRH